MFYKFFSVVYLHQFWAVFQFAVSFLDVWTKKEISVKKKERKNAENAKRSAQEFDVQGITRLKFFYSFWKGRKVNSTIKRYKI